MIPQVLLVLLLACANSQEFPNRCVDTNSGTLCGTTTNYRGQSVQAFLGIPYAEPPVGNLRFKKPRAVKPWKGTKMATTWPPACHQYTEYPFPWYVYGAPRSEDCLYLNVWAPGCTDRGDGKAVIFWIHGGSFVFGSSSMDLYDGSALASEGDVIVVTINYRLGVLGFLTSGTAEAPGNVGLFDMLEALKWVKENIEAFGGSPDRITIQGESAGSVAVSLFCISPLTKGLFSKATMQSGSIDLPLPNPREFNIQLSQKVAEKVGCASITNNIRLQPRRVIKCLREKNAAHLAYILYTVNPSIMIYFAPQYGDELVPENPPSEIRAGNFHDVPLLIGNDEDEGSVLLATSNVELFGVYGRNSPTVNKTLGEAIKRETFKMFPGPAAAVLSYLGSVADDSFGAIRYEVYTALGDLALVCPTLYFAESYAAKGNDVYFYFFQHRPSTTPWAEWMGVAHFEEVQFVFGVPLRKPDRYRQEEVQLSARMVQMWTDFAKFGHPAETCKWPKYNKEDHTYLTLSTKNRDNPFGTGPHLRNCNLFRVLYGF